MRNFIQSFENTKSLMSNNENDDLAIDCETRLTVCGKLVCRILRLLIAKQTVSKQEELVLFGSLYISPKELYSIYIDSKNNKQSSLICTRLKKRMNNRANGIDSDELTLQDIRKNEPYFLFL